MKLVAADNSYQLDPLQRIAMTMMAVLTLLTFVGTNMQALLWQSSDWLVSTVLPAVVIDLTNDERQDLAAAPLRRNATLDQAATLKAQHMAENEYFAHYAPDGTTPWSFFSEAGYVYAHAGENLAIHFTDSTEVVEAWMLSPAHRKNIVDTKYTEIGVGTAKGTFEGYDTVYVVQLFGAPAVSDQVFPELVEPVAASESPVLEAPIPPVDMVAIQAEIEQIAKAVEALDQSFDQTEVMVTQSIREPASGSVDVVPADPVSVPRSQPEIIVTDTQTVVVSTELATSSGLTVATFTEPVSTHAGATLAAVVTQPNVVLNTIYTGIVGVVIVLLLLALIGEVRRLHVVQVVYSLALLFAIGGLWYVHAILTGGAVIA